MRSHLLSFELRRVRSLDEALDLLSSEPGEWRPFAGGTDLMVLLEAGALPHTRYVNLWGLAGLRGITVLDDEVVLGALTTYTDVLAHPVLRAEFPILCRAAAETGTIATQNRGTIGGNIANASPAADSPPALLAGDAALDLVSSRGTRRVPYERFHTGYRTMDLAPDEIIAAVRLPRRRGTWIQHYRKVGTRRAQAISKVCVAAAARLEDGVIAEARIALGSVAPTVVRAREVEGFLTGRHPDAAAASVAASLVASDIAPIDDLRSTAAYRTRVAGRLVADFVAGLANGGSSAAAHRSPQPS